jgi:hypothetical protein
VSALLVVGVIALVVLVAYLAWRVERRRRERLQAYAARMGWSYAARDDSPLARFAGEPFRSGQERKCRHVLQGSYRGRPSLVFEFEYVTYTTDSEGRRQRQTHRNTVAALGVPAVLPWVQVKRENVLHRIGHALGFDDIELESEDFNRRFRVTAADRKLAYDLLHPRMMELLLHADGPAWRMENGALLCWAGGRLAPDRAQPMLDFAAAVVDNVPAFVWRSGSA